MPLEFDKLENEFLQMHLKYVENTMPPRIFHIWAALTCISACMQRHLYLETGIGKIYGNMYMLLVGPPATKKNSALRFARKVMAASTNVKIAPDDTGGQRQGLMTAMTKDDELEVDMETAKYLDPDTIANMAVKINDEDRHCMFAVATEFGSFIGQNNLELLRFLIKVWDGEDYRYQLNTTERLIEQPLLTIAGGTTPSDIAELLPPQAIGQGFTSRIIFVYASVVEKIVSLRRAGLRTELEPELQKVYSRAFYDMKGTMNMTDAAGDVLERLELQGPKVHDTRFIYYTERRPSHLIKLSMVLAVARGSMIIEERDVRTANMILEETEKHMPDALGEYGLAKLAVARQKMLEYLRFVKQPVAEKFLYGIMRTDMSVLDFKNSVSALIHADKIVAFDLKEGRHYAYKDESARVIASMGNEVLDSLLENPSEYKDVTDEIKQTGGFKI